MLRRRSGNPLPARDASVRYLPWVIAVMVYIAALALAGALVLDAAVRDWVAGLHGRITIEIPPPSDDKMAKRLDSRVADLVKKLGDSPDVASVRLLSSREIAGLIQPWLGEAVDSLPLPRLIDVQLTPQGITELSAFGRRVADAVPGARIEDHKPWLDKLLALGRSLQWLAGTVVALVALATIAVVGFATRAGLAMHRSIIEVLHLIGAHDSYVARQFQDLTLRISAIGAIAGLAVALATVFGLARLAAGLEVPLFPPLQFGVVEWVSVAATPLAAIAMATLTARWTVMRALKRMV